VSIIWYAHNVEKQAQKMIKTSNRKYNEYSVGTTVRLSIPDADRDCESPRNYTNISTLIIFVFKRLGNKNTFFLNRRHRKWIFKTYVHEIGNKSLQSKFIGFNYCFRIDRLCGKTNITSTGDSYSLQHLIVY
jgi:hypothetical protein